VTHLDLLAELRSDGELVTERLELWARESPDRTFVDYGETGVALSYAEFAERVASIAGNLAGMGVGKEGRVSVFCFDPLLSAQAMFGVWRANAVFCPVNFSYTGRLLSYQLNDTAPQVLVTEGRMVQALNAIAGDLVEPPRVVLRGGDPAELDPAYRSVPWGSLTADAAPPAADIAWHDVANIFYTSGTTGPSKGVLQPHRWMAQYCWALRRLVTSEDVIYNDLPLYHVGGAIANVARAAWAGCGVSLWDRFSSSDFWQRIEGSGATAAILLDVMIPWLLNAPESPDDRRNTLTKVHMQPLPLHHAQVARRFGFDTVTCGFGQTEAGNPLLAIIEEMPEDEGTPPELRRGLTRADVRAFAERAGVPVVAGEEVTRKGYMGLPSPYFEATVLDELDQQSGPDDAGELCFRPKLPGLLPREYLGKPEATVAATRNLWFHTGDAALRDEHGHFHFVDRLGDRIRVRGENLSSFQVEDVVNGHPDVELCAVFPIGAAQGDEDDIVLFAVATTTAEELTAWAEHELPKFMRPRHVRVVDDLPRTPTNKIEKYKLRRQILAELGRAESTAAAPAGSAAQRGLT
jgi:carnitine-CoA ligase